MYDDTVTVMPNNVPQDSYVDMWRLQYGWPFGKHHFFVETCHRFEAFFNAFEISKERSLIRAARWLLGNESTVKSGFHIWMEKIKSEVAIFLRYGVELYLGDAINIYTQQLEE